MLTGLVTTHVRCGSAARRPGGALPRLGWLATLGWLLCWGSPQGLAGAEEAAGAARDRPMTVDDLWKGAASSDAEPQTSDSPPGSTVVALLRLSASLAVIIAIGIASVVVFRRWTRPGGAGGSLGGVQVLGRTPLTPRHVVYLVRVGERCLAVGVSGERMTTLAEIDAAALPREDADPALRAPGSSARGG